jgi:hypothetical protein
MVERVAFVIGILRPFELGRDIKASSGAATKTAARASWPVYQGRRAWLIPLGDVRGAVLILFVL